MTLSLSTPSFGTVLGSRNTSTLTILDTSPCINFTSPTYTVTENKGPAQISVSRSGPTGILATVQFSTSDLTAVAGIDYTAVVNRAVTFLPGAKTVNVPITILNNTILDGNRSVNLSLSGAVGAQLVPSRSSAVLTIVDDEVGGTVQFAAALTTVTESVGMAQVLVSRTGSTAGGATVNFTTVNGTATAGADFGVIGNATQQSGTLTFLPGETTKPISVPIVNTGMADGVRALTLTLSNPNPPPSTAARLGARTITTLKIVDDEPALAFSAATYSVKENAGVATITVELTGVTAVPVTVTWATSDITATAGSDYGTPATLANPTPPPPSGTLTFPPGGSATAPRTKTFSVRILQDLTLEDTETVGLTLSGPIGASLVPGRDTAQLSIVDDDVGGTIQFLAPTYSVAEGIASGNASIVLTRTGGTGGGATIDYSTTIGGTAVAGTDYTPASGTVTFNAGQTSLTFPVPILDNATPDGVRTVNLALSNPGPNATTKLGTRSSAVLKIFDNDLSLAFSAPTYSVKESAGLATITVELAGVNVTPVTVAWAASDGTATAGSDYGTPATLANPTPPPPSGTLTFLPGGTPTTVRTKTFTVRVLQDRTLEPTETVNLTLSAPTGGAGLVAGRDTAVLSITEDDLGGVMQFSAATYTVGEAAVTAATIVISRTGSTAGGATVDYATSDGTGTAGTDYTATTGTATFAVGQTSLTFPVPIARQRDARRCADREPDAVESGARHDHEARDPIERGVEDHRQQSVAGLQRPQLHGAGERGPGHDHGRADRGECHAGDRELGVQQRHGDGRLRLRHSQLAHATVRSIDLRGGRDTHHGEDTDLHHPHPERHERRGPRPPDREPGAELATRRRGPAGDGPCHGRALDQRGRRGRRDPVLGPELQRHRVRGAAVQRHAHRVTHRRARRRRHRGLHHRRRYGGSRRLDYTATSSTVTFAASQVTQTIKIPLRIEVGAQPTKSFSVILSNPGGGGTLGVARTTATVNISDTR